MSQHKNQAVEELVNGLQEDLSREYQAIIAYTVYSNVLKGAQWMENSQRMLEEACPCFWILELRTDYRRPN